MKKIIKFIICIMIFFVILNCITNIFVRKGNGYGTDIISFYELDKNSLDIIFFGSSHAYATFSPDIIYEKTGMKSYNFATQQQPLYITYYHMLETLKTQNPSVCVLEVRGAMVETDYMEEGVTRDAIDKMKPSINKFNVINTSVESFDERCTYYFNIIKYHSRYNELTLEEIKDGLLKKGIDNKGYIGLPANGFAVENEDFINVNETKKLTKKNEEYLLKIINLAKEKEIKLIFVKSPCQLTLNDKMLFNEVERIAKENNITFIDYNKEFENLNLKFEDFYDKSHLSVNGSRKVSNDFSNRLINL